MNSLEDDFRIRLMRMALRRIPYHCDVIEISPDFQRLLAQSGNQTVSGKHKYCI